MDFRESLGKFLRREISVLIRTEVGKEDFLFFFSFSVHYPCNTFGCFPRCPLVSVKLF